MAGELTQIQRNLANYLYLPSVVGFEGFFLNKLADQFDLPRYEVDRQDKLVAVSSKKRSIHAPIVSLHVDRHGLVVNENKEIEYAAFYMKRQYGQENKSAKSIFTKAAESFKGEHVIAVDYKGNNLASGKVLDYNLNYENKKLTFEIPGIKDLPSGTPICYAPSIKHDNSNGFNTIIGQLDNVISAAVTRQLLDDGFEGTILLTCEEEIGRSWIYMAKYLENLPKPRQDIIVLDTSPYDDLKIIEKGPIILRNRDDYGIFNPDIVSNLRDNCILQQFPYIVKDDMISEQNAALPAGQKPQSLGKTELGKLVLETKGNSMAQLFKSPQHGIILIKK